MDDLVTWLPQQFDADERMAQNLDELGGWERNGIESTAGGQVLDYLDRFSPTRIHAEVNADRAILKAYEEAAAYYRANPSAPAGELHGLLAAIKHRATVYADRPGYQEEWRP